MRFLLKCLLFKILSKLFWSVFPPVVAENEKESIQPSFDTNGGADPTYWQMRIGQPLARDLQNIAYHTGMTGQLEVVSAPDKETYLIKVFRLDMSGETLHRGSQRRGFEIFRVEIRPPNLLLLAMFDDIGKQIGPSRLFNDPKGLTESARVMLTEISCVQWLNCHWPGWIESRWVESRR